MNSSLIKKNIITTVILQFVTIICGFVIPKFVLITFGSRVNGLVTSITQFLNYIQLLEGGLSGVVMAALYKPLAENNYKKISEIIKSTEKFFKQIAIIYLVYMSVLAVVYPLIAGADFSYLYVATLVLIIGISTFIQYFFSLTFRILINADRKGYIVSIANIAFLLVNLCLTIAAFKIFPKIHVIKLISAISFTIQPIIFSTYVKKNYKIDKSVLPDKTALKQRWDGFGQNFAFFIHTNTDVVVLTLLASLEEVSVYSVYLMIVSAIKNLIIAISAAISPSMGNVLVSGDEKRKNDAFDRYEFGIFAISTFLFTCCIVLIVPFVQVYTAGVEDANYTRPVFAVLITVAEAIYCLRDPLVAVAYASGHFKQTAKYAYTEAIGNIVISVILVSKLGIIGVAIGTFVAMAYRMIAHIYYLKKNILMRSVRKCVKNLAVFVFSGVLACAAAHHLVNISVTGYLTWALYAVIVVLIVSVCMAFSLLLFKRKMLADFIKVYVLKQKE